MLTKKDIKQLIQAFTSVFGTKADLASLATKKSLEKFATKKDLNRFATKKDMEKQHNEVVQKLDSIQDDLNSLTETTGNILSWTDDIH